MAARISGLVAIEVGPPVGSQPHSRSVSLVLIPAVLVIVKEGQEEWLRQLAGYGRHRTLCDRYGVSMTGAESVEPEPKGKELPTITVGSSIVTEDSWGELACGEESGCFGSVG